MKKMMMCKTTYGKQLMGTVLLSGLIGLSPLLAFSQMQPGKPSEMNQPAMKPAMKSETPAMKTTTPPVESKSNSAPASTATQPAKNGQSAVREKEGSEHETPAEERAENTKMKSTMKPVTTTHTKTTVHKMSHPAKKGQSQVRQAPMTKSLSKTEKCAPSHKTSTMKNEKMKSEKKMTEPMKKGQSEVRQAPATMTARTPVKSKTETMTPQHKVSEPVKKGQSEVRQAPATPLKNNQTPPVKESAGQKVEQGIKNTGKHIEQGWDKMIHH